MVYWKEIILDPPELKVIETERSSKIEPLFYDSEASKETEYVKKCEKILEQVKNAWVYIWMCGIGDKVVYGRYLHEFTEFITWVIDAYDVSPDRSIDIWVHNLSYDISYMYDLLYQFNGGTWENVSMICTKPRHFVSFNLENFGITFKCTYALTNRSLEQWCKDMCVENGKKVGMKDYNAVYYPWDDLPENELIYGEFDILAMKECFYKEIAARGYDFRTVPLTQTGFVRRDIQAAFLDKKNIARNKYQFYKTRTNENQYNRLLRACGGGMVQGNYQILGRKIEWAQGIGHVDFESHYPTQLRTQLYGWTPTSLDGDEFIMETLDYYESNGYDYLVDIVFGGLKLKPGITAPFMYESKCHAKLGSKIHAINGKIIYVSGEDNEIKTTCTNYDLRIFREQYDFEWYCITAVDIYAVQKLPPYILDVLDKYYIDKSEIKAKLKKDPKNPDLIVAYGIAKQKLNAIYGCLCTKSVKNNIYLTDDLDFAADDCATIDDFYKKYNSCCPMQVGVFCTALARYELYTVISQVVGYDAFLYCDTDSCFYKSTPEIEARVGEYRKWCREDSEKKGAFVTLDDGSKKYYHDLSPEDDHLKSKTFKTLHAKCYALEPDGELECTIAGVSEYNEDRSVSRETELGSIDNLEPGFEFVECGGTRADYTTIGRYTEYTAGGCAILNTTKKISATIEDEVEDDIL